MNGPNTQRVLRELKEDGFQIRLTFFQDEMSIHISHDRGEVTKHQEKIVTKRIMDATLKDFMFRHRQSRLARGKR